MVQIQLGKNLPSRNSHEWFHIGVANGAIILNNIGDRINRSQPSFANIWCGNTWVRADINDTIVYYPEHGLMEVRKASQNQLIDKATMKALKNMATNGNASGTSDQRTLVDVTINHGDISATILNVIEKLAGKSHSQFKSASRIKVIVE